MQTECSLESGLMKTILYCLSLKILDMPVLSPLTITTISDGKELVPILVTPELLVHLR